VPRDLREIGAKFAEHKWNDASVAKRQKTPRVGRIASVTFSPATEDVHRFPSSHKLVDCSGFRTLRMSDLPDQAALCWVEAMAHPHRLTGSGSGLQSLTARNGAGW